MRAKELECVRLAARQFGVVRRDQALQSVSAAALQRRLDSGAWVAVLPRVFRVEGAPETWRQKLKAISLWAGHGFALSHRTAAVLHGFRRFTGEPLELSVTRNLPAAAPLVVHRVQTLTRKDLASTDDGFTVTSVTRTLFDLAAIVPEATLRATVDEALQRQFLTLDRLTAALDAVEGARGRAFLAQLVHEYQGGDGPCESELEALVFERLDEAGLPRPDRQKSVFVAGRFRRLDFCFGNVVVETDGYAFHSSLSAFEKDRQRHNSLTMRGYKVLQWTWKALHERPEDLLAELAGLLAQSSGVAAPVTEHPTAVDPTRRNARSTPRR